MKFSQFFLKAALILMLGIFLQSTAAAKDEWLEVRSKNFNLIGNAPEKDIRAVGLKLEQFREALRQVLDQYNFNSPVPTTVIVFKSDDDYKPYKPVKANGEADKIVVGYFQAGEDINYITLSSEGDPARLFNIIFHEYTHFLVRNNLGESKIPPWYNEGMAEYYETFAIEDERKILLGAAQTNHLKLLDKTSLIPLENFFKIDNYSLHQQGDEGVGLFYAQAWALMHFFKHGNGGARKAQLDKFLRLVMADKKPGDAFGEAFEADYAQIETELKDYLKRGSFPVTSVSIKNQLYVDTEMKVSS